MKFYLKLLVLPLLLFVLQSCGNNSSGPGKLFTNVPAPFDTTQAIDKTTTDDNLTVYTIAEGFGKFEVVSRDQLIVRFTGRTTEGEVFDSSYREESTTSTFRNLTSTTFNTNFGSFPPLIDGVRRGLVGMVEGEKRTIVVPPALGYENSQKSRNGIQLQGRTLVFDIELVEIIDP